MKNKTKISVIFISILCLFTISNADTSFGISGVGTISSITGLASVINVPADQPSIQAGINAATNGDTVLVADSTYYENINFNGKAITVASHFLINGDTTHINGTIIDGSQPNNPDSGSVVSFVSGEDTNSVLCGFTITNGTGTISFYGADFRSGGGIFCYNSSASIISNKILNNTVSYNSAFGGGIGIVASSIVHANIKSNEINDNTINGISDAYAGGIMFINGSGKLVGNKIKNNSVNCSNSQANGGGVSLWRDTSQPPFVIIKENHVSYNSASGVDTPGYPGAWGGGLYIASVTAQVFNNRITHNNISGTVSAGGAGLCVHSATNTTSVYNNFITQNNVLQGTGMGGGIIIVSGNPSIENNIISHNSATNGGGIQVAYSTNPAIINNTIANNIATTGGGIYTNDSNPLVMNSIVWSNIATNNPGIYRSSGSINVHYSDVQGGYQGTGNIDVDPQMMDTLLTSGDTLFACLSAGSPCIDAGDPDPMYNDPEDSTNLGYALWPSMGTVRNDMGAYGGPGAAGWKVRTYTDIIQSEEKYPIGYQLNQNYPNPFNPTTTIEFTIPKSEFVTLKIYNLLGQEVANLVSEKLTPGEYKYTWDASQLASGMYFYRIQVRNPSTGSGSYFLHTKKMILLR
jgi:type IX secretion system substrate protein